MKIKNKKLGGRPHIESDHQLNRRISFAVSETEFRNIKRHSEKANLKIGIYARNMVLKGFVKQRITTDYLQLLRQSDGIANNLNQAVKKMHAFSNDRNEIEFKNQISEIMRIIKVFDAYQKWNEDDN